MVLTWLLYPFQTLNLLMVKFSDTRSESQEKLFTFCLRKISDIRVKFCFRNCWILCDFMFSSYLLFQKSNCLSLQISFFLPANCGNCNNKTNLFSAVTNAVFKVNTCLLKILFEPFKKATEHPSEDISSVFHGNL